VFPWQQQHHQVIYYLAVARNLRNKWKIKNSSMLKSMK